MSLIVIYFIFFSVLASTAQENKIYHVTKSSVSFVSDAPLETIKASSNKLKGVVDIENNTFAFSVEITSFNGFNSPLQREHFNENYMESDKFPKAAFTGKIIEAVNLKEDGSYETRAKGKLTIHGIEQERIIKTFVEVKNGSIKIDSNFSVILVDHNITIPKIVHQKISPEIFVEMSALCEPVVN